MVTPLSKQWGKNSKTIKSRCRGPKYSDAEDGHLLTNTIIVTESSLKSTLACYFLLVKNDKKPNLSALKTLTFEVKQKTQPIFSLANPEYFQQNRLSQVASHFDSSKIVLPENHTFMDLITAMERNEHFDKAASSNMTDSRMTHTSRLGCEKSLVNLAFAEKSYRSSIVFAPELRKESDMPPVRYIMPRSSSMELPRKGVMQKPLVRTAPKRETSGINDIIAFEQLKDHQKLNSLAGLAFVVSKRSKSKYLSMYYELVRETASKHDWSKYRKGKETDIRIEISNILLISQTYKEANWMG